MLFNNIKNIYKMITNYKKIMIKNIEIKYSIFIKLKLL